MPDPSCPDADVLRRVAAAAEGGLSWPPTLLSFDALAPDAAAWLHSLANDAAGALAFARTLRRFAVQAEALARRSPGVALVTTGPDDAGLSRPTLAVVDELIREASQMLLVAGFAVHRGREVFALLADRLDSNPSLRARLVLNVPRAPADTSAAATIVARFCDRFRAHDWPGHRLPEVYHDPRALAKGGAERASFHAKCIVADGKRALVTSANPTEAAYRRNIELGVMVEGNAVPAGIEAWFTSLIRHRHLERLPIS